MALQLGATEPDLRSIGEPRPDGPDRLWLLLEQAGQRWLLVIDNADDPELLAPRPCPWPRARRRSYRSWPMRTAAPRPGQSGLVLVTSRQRSPDRWGAASLQPVGTLSLDQGQGWASVAGSTRPALATRPFACLGDEVERGVIRRTA